MATPSRKKKTSAAKRSGVKPGAGAKAGNAAARKTTKAVRAAPSKAVKAAAQKTGKGKTTKVKAKKVKAAQAKARTAKAARPASATRKVAPASAPARPAPGKVRLTMMTGEYEIVRALKDGTVKPKGIDLVIGGFPGTEHIHGQVEQGHGCDINEFNGGAYVIAKQQGRDFTSLPVFLHRRFRHGFIYVNKAKVKRPADLIGKRIGSGSIDRKSTR